MIRCTVYDSEGEELFWEEDDDWGVAAFNASERVRAEYSLLIGMEWRFERIQPPVVLYEPPDTLAEWDEYVLARRAEIFGSREHSG